MRIALLTYSTKPRGGVVHTLALAEALARLDQEVTVVSIGRGGDVGFFRPVDPAVTVRIVPFGDGPPHEPVGPRVRRSIAALSAGLDRRGFDIVHAQDCISANACLPCLRTVHHTDRFETPELVRCHDRAIVEADGHICVSQAVADELHDGWGIQATVIPNGVDAGPFAAAAGPPGDAGRREWAARIGARYVLNVGGIEPRKATIDLLEAMAMVHAAVPDVRWVIAGGETLFDYRAYRRDFDQRCSYLGEEPVILGPVGQAELPTLVAGASAFAFPSVKEGFGMAALEAAAAGVPVVVRDRPVFHQVFGDAVLYGSSPSELAGAILSCLGGVDQQGRLEAGRAVAASYTWEASALAHLEVYRAFLTR